MNLQIAQKNLLLILFLCFSEYIYSQTKEEVDIKIVSSRKLTAPENKDEYLQLMDEIVSESSKISYAYGNAYGYYGKSKIAFNSRDFSKSTQFAKLAEKEDIDNEHLLLKIKIYQILGLNNNMIGYDNDAIKYYKKMILSAKNLKDERQSIYHENIAYNDMASLYGLKKRNMDSASYYMKKVYTNLSSYSNRDVSMNVLLGKASVALASYYDLIGKKDSSDFYLNKSRSQVPTHIPEDSKNPNVPRQLSSIYLLQGKLNEAEKSNDILLKKAEKSESAELLKEGYKRKYLISEKKGNLKTANNYLKKYTKVSDSLNSLDDMNVKKAYNNIIKEKDQQIISKAEHSRFLIMIIAFIVIIILLLGYYAKKRSDEKRLILNKKQSEISELEGKINLAFDEVVLLAKNNDPTFLSRFLEVYPEFGQKIINIYPGIQNSELEFCAYIRLNFSTKDIANFIFVTPKTIQMRKYRLRKKLNIPSEDDIYIWINNL
ncbi:hypothetical protein MQX03_15505 [Chryseobacterium aahli]|uniref:helix-turn-helix transcriptional regulator n=1 Tax=Chryseobacterium aahli TaxID=1278643 RepID=UPI001F61D861|nr:hypothetical protein [Chryseobacterium aahli]MCI3938605.1 hypothetical protein [Chryseobacterium aahli]